MSNVLRNKDRDDLSTGSMQKYKDEVHQLRQEFKTAIKDLRNDVC